MPDPNAPEPEPEITLDEWIAASQSCCGAEPDRPRRPTPPADPDAGAVQSTDAPQA